MTLLTLCKELGEMAKAQHLINFSAAGSSLGEINPLSVDWYPLFYIIPAGTHTVQANTTKFDLVLYYIDRLLEDNTNTIDIFSSSIENLKNIINGTKNIPGVVDIDSSYTIRNFMPEKLDDRLCGAYASVRISVANDNCFVDGELPEPEEEEEGDYR